MTQGGSAGTQGSIGLLNSLLKQERKVASSVPFGDLPRPQVGSPPPLLMVEDHQSGNEGQVEGLTASFGSSESADAGKIAASAEPPSTNSLHRSHSCGSPTTLFQAMNSLDIHWDGGHSEVGASCHVTSGVYAPIGVKLYHMESSFALFVRSSLMIRSSVLPR